MRCLALDVRFGSKADISACVRDVRFTPKSGHAAAARDASTSSVYRKREKHPRAH